MGAILCMHSTDGFVSDPMVESQQLGTHRWPHKFWAVMDYLSDGAVSLSEDLVRGQLEDIPNAVEKFSK